MDARFLFLFSLRQWLATPSRPGGGGDGVDGVDGVETRLGVGSPPWRNDYGTKANEVLTRDNGSPIRDYSPALWHTDGPGCA